MNLMLEIGKSRGQKLPVPLVAHLLNSVRGRDGLFRIEVRRQASQAMDGALNLRGVARTQTDADCGEKLGGIFDKVRGQLRKSCSSPPRRFSAPAN